MKIGQIELPKKKTKGKYVPEADKFKDDTLLETLAFGIKENLPVLLVGETGTGKTSAVRYLASETNNDFRRLNLNGQTTTDEFVGKMLINEKGTYWVDGILTEALREGQWLLLDEINASLPEILFVLQSLLDDDRFIVLSDKEDKEIVRPHKDFRLFATMNPTDGYVGTKDLNKALMSRFPIVVGVDYSNKEVEILTERTGIDEGDAERLVSFAQEVRNSYKEKTLDFVLSTRELINWVTINKLTKDWMKSAQIGFLNKCNVDDREAVADVLKLHFANKGSLDAKSLAKGAVLKTLAHVTLPNTKFIVPKGSVFKVLESGQLEGALKNQEVGSGLMYSIQVLSVPAKVTGKVSGDKITDVGDEWSVNSERLEGNVRITKVKHETL